MIKILTIIFTENSKRPLYEQLYASIKQSIEKGVLKPGEKLPSKRKLSAHLKISVNTVINAYDQLTDEGYLESIEKKGFYVRQADWIQPAEKNPLTSFENKNATAKQYEFELNTNNVDTANFPFTTWTKLLRESLRDEQNSLLEPSHPQGNLALRQEIAIYLRNFRNIRVSPEQIILGAGMEYLLGLIVELLPGHIFALENPCYHKTMKVLTNKQVPFEAISIDGEGMRSELLQNSGASVALITPSRHFPMGTVMSAGRRTQLLKWSTMTAEQYLIEDDYDFEYRYRLRQIPALYSMDNHDKTIYLNTFARTLAPSLRIGYMVLPPKLLKKYNANLHFYSCTVSAFEQSTLKRFLQNGHYERHINRMRTIYKSRRDAFITTLAPLLQRFEIIGDDAGLHFLIRSNNGVTEKSMLESAKKAGVKVYGLSNYYIDESPETHTVIAGYGGLSRDMLVFAAKRLVEAWGKL